MAQIKSLRIVFAGTPDFAAKHLAALLDSPHEVVAVYSQPDRPAGRGKKLQASPVKVLAEQSNLPVYQPQSLKTEEAQTTLAALNADVMVVVAYGLILPLTILQTPYLGCINVHGSLLPKWRGAAPIQRSIWAGDSETGVTIMQMDEGLDTGAMLHKASIPIESDDTSASLYEKLANVGPLALIETLNTFEKLTPIPQDNEMASYAKKLSKEEANLDWQSSAVQIERNVRAFNPWPIVWFKHHDQSIKVWNVSIDDEPSSASPGTIVSANKMGIRVATGEGVINLKTLQLPGKKPLSAADILNSKADWFVSGTVLS